jgi:ubiquinone/menaquinone biosynthesis C-methylase UbiE
MSEFDRVAQDYESIHNKNLGVVGESSEFFVRHKVGILAKFWVEHALPSDGTFLDFGCGIGRTRTPLAECLPQVRYTGVDPSMESIEIARGEREAGPEICSVHRKQSTVSGTGTGNCKPVTESASGTVNRNPVTESGSDTGTENRTPFTDPEKNAFFHFDGKTLPFPDQSFNVVLAACVLHHVLPQDRPRIYSEIRRVLKPGGFFIAFEHNPYNPLTQYIVRTCEFDDDAILIPSSELRTSLSNEGFSEVDRHFVLFLPRFLRERLPTLEDRLAWCPAGAQYWVSAQK